MVGVDIRHTWIQTTAQHSAVSVALKRKIFLLWSLLSLAGGKRASGGEREVKRQLGDPHPKAKQQLTPTHCKDRATRTRPQSHRGCSYQGSSVSQGLWSPGSGHGSERPPGWALRGPLVRGFSSHSHPSAAGTESLTAPWQQFFHCKSGPRNRTA